MRTSALVLFTLVALGACAGGISAARPLRSSSSLASTPNAASLLSSSSARLDLGALAATLADVSPHISALRTSDTNLDVSDLDAARGSPKASGKGEGWVGGRHTRTQAVSASETAHR